VINRKATIVITLTADVAHYDAALHVYRKWNGASSKRNVQLCLRSHSDGSRPLKNWYKSEPASLDFYIIPLAKKLKECGRFGVSMYWEYSEPRHRNRGNGNEQAGSCRTDESSVVLL
jgi:hypothetical protein